jgi:hypothetical protein
MIALLVIFGLFILGFVITIVALVVDWRALFQKKFGDDAGHGEAVFIVNGKRSYQQSERWYEGAHADSYWRKTTLNGKPVIYDDIAPHPPAGVPVPFDSNGRRMYWPIEGNAICSNAEKTDYQFTNYPPEMMSSDVQGRTAVQYGRSVQSKDGHGGLLWLVAGLVVILAIASILFLVLKPKPSAAPVTPSNTTISQNSTAPSYPPGAIIGVPIPPDQGGK